MKRRRTGVRKFGIEPMSDSALLIEFGDRIDEGINRLVQAAVSRLEADPFPGFVECIPSFAAMTVFYDPIRLQRSSGSGTAHGYVSTLVTEMLRSMEENVQPAREVIDIPVCYGGEFGPDLAYVAELNGLDEAEVVKIHSSQDYLVYALGFAPGFPYLGGMPASISAPRKATPRLSIPAGSVGIAGTQTGIYPLETPGGWQIIGRTPLALFRPEQDPPVLLRSGQYIRFSPIDASVYNRLAGGRG
ncbi:5-oxoprolinase subunit PxpB [Paenibacillus sp. VCA1]|uniref:5-oxoprolinase subunit PxpB n=1 Tax=Paenibacillus sp. VCA1 TaxID=3039148 RepID=UPI00287166A3|nr:5-oxoprolinase subunit PxpB [Paenibacillus sp. VCA1]MDR9854939.1 5-oxoprolinase subunit PxpB [Paenibacillus sp. VCA1]